METLGTCGHMGAMHGIASVSAPCFSSYQYGNSRPVFCHAQPPCFKLGSQILALGLHVCFQFSAVVSTLFCAKARRRSRIIPKTLALSVVTQSRWVDSLTRRLLPRRAIHHGFFAALSEKGKDHVWVSTYCALQEIQSHWQTLTIFAFLALAPATNLNLIYLGATQTICNAQRCQKETSEWFDALKRSLWNTGKMLKLESWITRYPTKNLRPQLWQFFDGLGPSSQCQFHVIYCMACLSLVSSQNADHATNSMQRTRYTLYPNTSKRHLDHVVDIALASAFSWRTGQLVKG